MRHIEGLGCRLNLVIYLKSNHATTSIMKRYGKTKNIARDKCENYRKSGRTVSDHIPTLQSIEELLVNNPAVLDIEAYLQRFNPIRVMKMERMEIRHSAILGWLLDPTESHGMSDAFLKSFLSEALKGRKGLDAISALDILSEDFSTARVRVEWLQIDIFVHLARPDEDWIFIIENKVDHVQHKDQLKTYYEKILRHYNSNTKVCGVFLSLHDEKEDDFRYAPIRYTAILEILEDVVNRATIPDNVSVFIRHYCNILKDITDMNPNKKKMVQLARKLYREHHKVINFIVGHGSDTEFGMAMRSLFGDVKHYEGVDVEIDDYWYEFGGIGATRCDFLPGPWSKALYYDKNEDEIDWELKEEWWMGYPMVCWLELSVTPGATEGSLKLYGEVGPLEDERQRVALIERVECAAEVTEWKKFSLRRDAKQEGRKYVKFFKKNSEKVTDIHDPNAIEAASRELLKRFRPEFDAIGEKIKDAYKLVKS